MSILPSCEKLLLPSLSLLVLLLHCSSKSAEIFLACFPAICEPIYIYIYNEALMQAKLFGGAEGIKPLF